MQPSPLRSPSPPSLGLWGKRRDRHTPDSVGSLPDTGKEEKRDTRDQTRSWRNNRSDALDILLAFLFSSLRHQKKDPAMEVKDFKRETLNAHNNYRTMHGCPPLVMSEELTNTAQAWAEKLADRGILQYSENPNLGENICVVDLDPSPSRKGEQVVKEWYKEIDHYNYDSPGWKRGAYRVSQLLWKSTSEIGVGIAKLSGQKRAFVVVNYRPAGNNNIPGEFERNVLPPIRRNADDNANVMRRTVSPRRS